MECFENSIGLKGVCNAPTTNLWLNTIGVSKMDCDNIVTSEYSDVMEFVNEKIDGAVAQIANEVNSNFQRHYITNTIVDGARLGFRQNNMDELTASGVAGISMAMRNQESYLKINITSISLFIKHSGAVTINIYDLKENRIIDTVAITAISGETVTVYPNIEIESPKRALDLLIGYDTTGKDTSYKTMIRNGACCGDYTCNQQFVSSRGAQITSGTFHNDQLETLTHTAGLSLTYSVSCYHEGWLCNHIMALATPILYKVASEIMLHGIHSSPTQRANNTQTLDRALLKERHEYYERKYDSTIDNVLNGLQLPTDPRCFQCSNTHRNVIALP